MSGNYLSSVFIACSYILIGLDQPVIAQSCQNDMASAFLNSVETPYSDLFFRFGKGFCGRGVAVACSTECQGPLSSACCRQNVCVCGDAGFCSSTSVPLNVFSTAIVNTCTSDVFVYGEYVAENYIFSETVPLYSRKENWPLSEGTYEGYGVVQMGTFTKVFYFLHLLPTIPIENLGVLSPSSCYGKFGSAFLNPDVIGNNQHQNFGLNQPPSVPTCATTTSCPTAFCNWPAAQVCVDGTCICSMDPGVKQVISNPSLVITTTSTNACNQNTKETFYYGEIISQLPIINDPLFTSSLVPQLGGSWTYIGMGTVDMTYGSEMRKDFVFVHKYFQ